ncbi:glutamate--tRNA ligase [Candidatus Woesearchaeota archaeon]|nr:glutamate--tRNA ligase [Candidatus Woesearchaeota archaeon]
MGDIDTRIEAHALHNRVKYGSAQTGKVIPKIIGEFPDVKKDIGTLKPKIDSAVEKANGMDEASAHSRLEEIAPDLLEKKEHKKREMPELPNAEQGKVVTRLPPEPSKHNHLGHALTFIINAIYAKRYDGQLVLRFEDCNPEKVTQEYVDEMLSDIQNYLGIEPDEIRYVSDDMDDLIMYAEKLINNGHAYMCFCSRESVGENRRARKECAHRDSSKEENLKEWEAFKAGAYMEGECVLRFKGDMQSKNTVLLDPVLFRAVKAPHYKHRETYKVWPLYDFYSGIEDHMCGVTHVIRSNEFDLRKELQLKIQDILGLTKPEMIHYGRFNIKGATTKGREIREGIEHGEYIGWDDPRLVTLKTLQRRGIKAEAYWALVKDLGMSPYPVNLDFSMLSAKNRDIIDPIANRYSFIENPQEISVRDVKSHNVELHLHPDKKDGGRVLKSAGKYFVRADDKVKFSKKKVRLMGDITFDGDTLDFISSDVKDGHDMIINWLSAEPDQTVEVEIMMPDATVKIGLAEAGVKNIKVGEIIQFERFGFCRLDEKEDEALRFWYAHD